MIKKLFFAIILGIFCTLFVAQYDEWTHKKIIVLMQKIAQESLASHFSCRAIAVNFFTPSLVLYDVEVKPMNDDKWSWQCKQCELSCSWLQLLFKGTMDQHLVIDDFDCRSASSGVHLAIEPYIMVMTQQSFVPFSTSLKSMIFRNAHFFVRDEQHDVEGSFFFNSSSLRIGKQIKTMMSLNDGQLLHKKRTYVAHIATDISLTTEWIDDHYDVGVQLAGTFVLPQMDNHGGCYITGSWKSDCGRFSVRNAYNSFLIDPIIITERELRLQATLPLAYAARCALPSITQNMINGNVHCTVKVSRDAACAVDGQCVVEDISINNYFVSDVGKVIFLRNDDEWKMRCAISRYNQECKGSGHWNEITRKGELNIKNSTELSFTSFPHWRIKHDNAQFCCTFYENVLTGNYEMQWNHALRDAVYSSSGQFTVMDGVAKAQGMIDTNQFVVEGTVYPEISLQQCVYKDQENKQLFALHAQQDNKIVGSLSLPFIRSLTNHCLHYDLQAEGAIGIVAECSTQKIIADIALQDGIIRLPQTYNFIDGCTAHCVYNFAQRLLVVENGNLSLHTGNVHCLRATAYFDAQGALTFAHAPCILDRCLLNSKKDLFAIVSGSLLFSKQAASDPLITGRIIIDKSQLKENLFSGVIQKQLFSYTHSAFSTPDFLVNYDIGIETKLPIIVDTGFLKAQAQMNVRVKKDAHEPSIQGSVALHAGVLHFPYKPLYIAKGVINFTDQLYDPTIELIARNKIKKYDVTLQVEGSLLTHQIVLDATPPLSEEQIVGLLLVGSEEQSLNAMIPALIVQNLKNLIFSNNQASFFDKYFKPLLGSLHINLVPSFADQTGRGGLRGALEITLDDRWRAVIQKNFSLTEDTKFELEFLLSDDVTLRAIRDERRDIAGEVEMRWKF
jgi:hypothetical protein